MAIKDPIDALEKYFATEDLSSDPVLSRLAKFASALELPWPAGRGVEWILGRLSEDRLQKIELTLKVIVRELRGHDAKLDEIRNQKSGLSEEWFGLVKDGLKKAEQTRAKERVERIGRILAKSLVTSPRPSADDVEEMMRIAMELSDHDVELLKELVRIQGQIVRQGGRIARFDAWNSWPNGSWGEAPDSDIDSTFSKLESFGLVTRLAPPNNLNLYADLQNRYALLKKGFDFVRFAQSKI